MTFSMIRLAIGLDLTAFLDKLKGDYCVGVIASKPCYKSGQYATADSMSALGCPCGAELWGSTAQHGQSSPVTTI
jgi:hypothetical protein